MYKCNKVAEATFEAGVTHSHKYFKLKALFRDKGILSLKCWRSSNRTEPELSWLLVTYCWRCQGVSTYFLKKLHACTCPRLISYPIIWWDFPEGIFFLKMWKLSHISTYMFTNIVPLHTINKMFFRWDLYESKPDYTRLKNVFTNRATAMEQRTTRLCT